MPISVREPGRHARKSPPWAPHPTPPHLHEPLFLVSHHLVDALSALPQGVQGSKGVQRWVGKQARFWGAHVRHVSAGHGPLPRGPPAADTSWHMLLAHMQPPGPDQRG